LSSTYGVANGMLDNRFWAWQMPFLFDSYEEVEMAFATGAAETLLADFSAATPVHALAYTLSGGLRLVASAEPITTLADIEGLRIATAGGPVAEAIWKSVGAIPVASDSPEAADADAVETTYARLTDTVGSRSELTRYIAETNHSLFLTTLVANDIFYDSLTPEEQQALVRAANTAAAVERADAIALNESTKSALAKEGSAITVLGETEREAFKNASASVYDAFAPIFDSRILSAE
jgi:TRAP-type C4-dicarboxylate transport system substrate-binding protein